MTLPFALSRLPYNQRRGMQVRPGGARMAVMAGDLLGSRRMVAKPLQPGPSVQLSFP